MHRGKSDGTVDADFTYPFINGSKHGVKNDKRGDQDRYEQVTHTAETRHSDTAVEICVFIASYKEVKGNAVHERCHDEV